MLVAAALCLVLNLIAFAQSNAIVIDERGVAEAQGSSAALFKWIGPEVTSAARNKSGCGSRACKDLSERFPVTDTEIWGTADEPVVSPEVCKWASELAQLHIQAAASNSSGPLRKGQLEEVFHDMIIKTQPYSPANRLLHVKVVGGKVYIIGASALDSEPSMMSYWSTGLLRGILKILERTKMPDWEAMFTCTANSYDVIQPFKPRIPIFTHCASGAHAKYAAETKYGVAIPIPRPYALWRRLKNKKNPLNRTVGELQQILQDKTPRAVFRGALSGPLRINLFQLSNEQANKEYMDVGMTKVPAGAPCENKPAWCMNEDGPPGWVQKYGLKQGDFMKPAEQMQFRYVIVVDGVGCPDRVSTLTEYNLGSDSVVLWQRTALSEFWFPDLKPWVHYIPVQENFTDLVELVSTYNNKLEELARIVLNAQEYVRTYHHTGAWLQYLWELMAQYAAEYIDYEIEVPPHAVQVVLTGDSSVRPAE